MRNLFILVISCFLALFFICVTIANAQNVNNAPEINTNPQNTTVTNTIVGNAQDWGLSQEEWGRYQQLMQGPSAKWYPNLSPAAILGLNAKTIQEQQHFAEMVAKEEHDKLVNELQFNNAVHQSLLKLYPQEPVVKSFNISSYNPVQFSQSSQVFQSSNKGSATSAISTTSGSASLQSGDHIALFVDVAKGIDSSVLPQLITDIKNTQGTVLDIFCVSGINEISKISKINKIDKISDTQLQAWAKTNNIPPDLVSRGRITLNHDNGRLQKSAGNNITLPYILLIRNGESKSVSVWSLS